MRRGSFTDAQIMGAAPRLRVDCPWRMLAASTSPAAGVPLEAGGITSETLTAPDPLGAGANSDATAKVAFGASWRREPLWLSPGRTPSYKRKSTTDNSSGAALKLRRSDLQFTATSAKKPAEAPQKRLPHSRFWWLR